MARNDYVVATPLVIAHTPRGDAYVGQGATLPEDTDAAQVQMLKDEGQIVTRSSYEGQQALVGPFVGKIDGQPDAPEEAQTEAESVESDSKPTSRSTVAEWREYAVAQGMPQADADAATKAELSEKYGA